MDKDVEHLDVKTESVAESRRQFIRAAGRLAIYTPPAIIALMQPSLLQAKGSIGARSKCDNGVGNGPDCLPPGLVDKSWLDNDDVGGIPGSPQNRN